ncbi:hypothetical protein SDC9_151239 [bioreactor metagenome]|uniref:Uncharacterized protein n=1 Tax=bioreactor metagenome TaxID=1076179 RepID=A0A645EU09_9ZZZZ
MRVADDVHERGDHQREFRDYERNEKRQVLGQNG